MVVPFANQNQISSPTESFLSLPLGAKSCTLNFLQKMIRVIQAGFCPVRQVKSQLNQGERTLYNIYTFISSLMSNQKLSTLLQLQLLAHVPTQCKSPILSMLRNFRKRTCCIHTKLWGSWDRYEPEKYQQSIADRSEEVILPLYVALVRPHLTPPHPRALATSGPQQPPWPESRQNQQHIHLQSWASTLGWHGYNSAHLNCSSLQLRCLIEANVQVLYVVKEMREDPGQFKPPLLSPPPVSSHEGRSCCHTVLPQVRLAESWQPFYPWSRSVLQRRLLTFLTQS